MEFGLLGTLEVRGADGSLVLGRRKQRALLVLLLLNANRVVPRERLIDELWGDEAPDSAVKALQVYVSQLRKRLPAGMLVTRRPGYLIEVDPEAVDVLRFERLVEAARSADPEAASSLLREALALWRGPPLSEFAAEAFWRGEAGRLEGLRLAALEERIEVDLALGRHAGLVAELEALVSEHLHRERLRGQLMLALYRSGRQAEALAAYRDARTVLNELGIEPGTGLTRLERQILTQDAALELPSGRRAAGRVELPGTLVPAAAFPFVGRSQELAQLRSLLERAERGEGGLVLLGAEAGGGKTRLLRELAHDAAGCGVRVLYGTSDPVVSTPYQPLREWFEFLARVSEPKVLDECMGERRRLLAWLVPGLSPSAPPPAGDAEVDRFALQGAVCEVLGRLSRAQPAVLVADDLHWADAETLQLLRRLARVAPETRLLVVAAYRDRGEELSPAFSETLVDLSRLDGVTRISPGRLSEEDIGAFIRAAADADASSELTSAIGELTGGTPLLLCELWRDLRDGGALEVSEAGVGVKHPLAELRGPDRLRDVVHQRLARLSPGTAAAVELAAVSGPRFELQVLAEAAGLDGRGVTAAVGEAVRAGLVDELPEPVPACRFTHELVRRAIYDRITGIDRAELHLRIGEALQGVHASDPGRILPELAHHFTLAVPVAGVERAVAYNLRAGEAALAAVAFDEAAARLSTALELGIDDPRERARIQVELAHLLYEMGRLPEADAMLATSLDAATGLEERGIAARALVDRMGHRSGDPALDVDEVRTVIEAAMSTLTELGDSRGLAVAGRYLAIFIQGQGRMAEGLAVAEQALVDADASGDQTTRLRVVGTLAHSLCRGPTPVAEASRRCEQLLESSRGDIVLEARLRRFLALLFAMAGRFDEAREQLLASSVVLDELRHQTTDWVYRSAAADARKLVGDHRGAEQDLIAAWVSFREYGDHAVDTRAMGAAYGLAALYCDCGRWDDAAECLAFGSDQPLERSTLTASLRLAVRARLAAHHGRLADALANAQRAVQSVDTTDALNLRAEVSMALAEVQHARGATTEAAAAAAEAIRLYEAKGNAAAAAQVRATAM